MSETPSRPVMRYHGGKWRLAPWIISHFPSHDIYVEPYCGAASVLMRKPRVHGEVINDLNGEIVNVFRVLRDPDMATNLERRVRLTPFARAEFDLSYEPSDDPVEQARRTLVRAFMGFGTSALGQKKTGFRARSYCRSQTGAADWASWPDQICCFTKRLSGVIVENRDAIDCIRTHDSKNTLFYVDPPYLPETRTAGIGGYCYEMDEEAHEKLLVTLLKVKGYVVLSGYPNPLYDQILQGWRRVSRLALASGGSTSETKGGIWRTEVLWLSPNILGRQIGLFDAI